MTVSDIQRWTEVLDQTDPYSPNPDMREADYGSYVTYADHVAAVAAARADEREAAAQRVIKQGVSIVAVGAGWGYIMLSLAVAAARGEQT